MDFIDNPRQMIDYELPLNRIRPIIIIAESPLSTVVDVPAQER